MASVKQKGRNGVPTATQRTRCSIHGMEEKTIGLEKEGRKLAKKLEKGETTTKNLRKQAVGESRPATCAAGLDGTGTGVMW